MVDQHQNTTGSTILFVGRALTRQEKTSKNVFVYCYLKMSHESVYFYVLPFVINSRLNIIAVGRIVGNMNSFSSIYRQNGIPH